MIGTCDTCGYRDNVYRYRRQDGKQVFLCNADYEIETLSDEIRNVLKNKPDVAAKTYDIGRRTILAIQ